MEASQQIVLVSGGASGLGEACVAYFKAQGAKLVVWDKHASAAADLDVICDVASSDSVEAAMHETIERLGIPRICIQCAGIAPAKCIVGKEGPMPLDDFTQVIAVNLIGTFNVMRVVAAAMRHVDLVEEERGVIINTASIAAFEGQIGQAAYSASKGGVLSMTLPAARELARWAIRVNTIAPGLVATPMLLGMPQTVQDHLIEDLIFPKRFGKPAEFAQLAGQIVANPLLNGTVIRLDGALRMQ